MLFGIGITDSIIIESDIKNNNIWCLVTVIDVITIYTNHTLRTYLEKYEYMLD